LTSIWYRKISKGELHNFSPDLLGTFKQATFQPQPMWAITINVVDMDEVERIEYSKLRWRIFINLRPFGKDKNMADR